MIRLKSKLPQAGATIFSVMTRLANEHGAINLSQGFPDFPADDNLINLVHQHMQAGHNQYAPMAGHLPLREKLAMKLMDQYSKIVNPETEITITAGGTQALFAAIACSIREGDEVIVFDPAYDSYVPAIQLQGGIPIHIPLKYPDFDISWELVKKRVSPQTKMIIINTPHNPSGAVMNAFDLMQLEKLVDGTDIIILSDEVYEHITFEGVEHQSVLRFSKLAARSFVVFSFGKTYHVTGWKTGYCVAPAEMMKEFRKVHQYEVFSANAPIQCALADYLDNKEAYANLGGFYQSKRDLFIEGLSTSRFGVKPSQGTYFQLLDYSRISDEPDTAFAERLTKEFKVAAIPVSVFYRQKTDNKVLRFCFAKSEDTINKAVEILGKI